MFAGCGLIGVVTPYLRLEFLRKVTKYTDSKSVELSCNTKRIDPVEQLDRIAYNLTKVLSTRLQKRGVRTPPDVDLQLLQENSSRISQ
jgi:hypothetical protein